MTEIDLAPLKAELKSLKAEVHEGHLYRGAGGARLWRYLELLRGSFSPDAAFHLLEIGLNAGHSAYAVLAAFPNARVTSLDVCVHPYTAPVAAWLQARFGRHELLVGDSRRLLPELAGRFDVIFVDGGHAYVTAKSDLANVRRFAPALVIMDDVLEATRPRRTMKTWHRGPTRAWFEAVEDGRILDAEQDVDMILAWGRLATVPPAPR